MPVKKYLLLGGLELENVLIEEAVAGRKAVTLVNQAVL